MTTDDAASTGRIRTVLTRSAIGLAALFVIIQLVPYGRDHTNPPVVAEPSWDSARTRQLAVAACYDCHSNETRWPWYSSVAPVSWLTRNHVDEGRRVLNFSEWAGPTRTSGESAEVVREGEMPPPYYRFLHAGARLSDSERAELIAGLQASLGG